VGTSKQQSVPAHNPGEDSDYDLPIPVTLDPNSTYRAQVHATTQYDESDKNDDETYPTQFKGVDATLFKTLTMKITNEGLEFSTTGTEPLKMVCTATLPTVLAAVTEPPDISKEPASTSPKCDFTNAELFTTQGPAQPGGNAQAATQPAAANSPSGGAPPQSVQFLIHAEPDDQSGRTQQQTLSLSASLPQADANNKKINWANVISNVKAGGTTNSKNPLATGVLGTIVRIFLSLAPKI